VRLLRALDFLNSAVQLEYVALVFPFRTWSQSVQALSHWNTSFLVIWKLDMLSALPSGYVPSSRVSLMVDRVRRCVFVGSVHRFFVTCGGRVWFCFWTRGLDDPPEIVAWHAGLPAPDSGRLRRIDEEQHHACAAVPRVRSRAGSRCSRAWRARGSAAPRWPDSAREISFPSVSVLLISSYVYRYMDQDVHDSFGFSLSLMSSSCIFNNVVISHL